MIEAYNTGMGGVDIIDQVMSYYRSKSCTVKYSVRVMLHFLDLACANAWLEYRMDCKVCYVPTLDSVEFKLRVAKDLIGGNCVHECNPPSESDLEEEGVSSNGRMFFQVKLIQTDVRNRLKTVIKWTFISKKEWR